MTALSALLMKQVQVFLDGVARDMVRVGTKRRQQEEEISALKQQIENLMELVSLGGKSVKSVHEQMEKIQKQIDEIDEKLLTILAKRMRISKEIGIYKKEHNMPILQSGRYNDILENRAKQGEALNLSGDFVTEIMKAIHEESVKVQMEIMK